MQIELSSALEAAATPRHGSARRILFSAMTFSTVAIIDRRDCLIGRMAELSDTPLAVAA